MQNIHGSQIKEIYWYRQWYNFMAWGMEDNQWKEKTNFLEQAIIHHFLGAPQIPEFDRWKEEAINFLVSHYSGYL